MRARTRSFPSRLATRSTRRRAPATAIQAPCEEIDQIDRLDSGTTFTKRAFYDGEGRLVETRASGFNSQDVVIFAYYDTAGRQIFKSNTYFVAAYTGAPGAAAYSIPDSTQPGTTTNYALNAGITTLRTTSVTNPNSFTTKTIVSVVCNVSGTSDMGCYVQKMVVDANGHGRATLTGGLGKANYTQTYTGVGGSYTLYTTTTMTYDSAGNLLSTKSPDGSTTTTLASNLAYSGLAGAAGQITTMDYGSGDIYTASYDTGLRLTSVALTRASDNTLLYQTQPAYDAANNVVSVQTSITGATDTQQFCYDALNRLTWAGASGTPPCATLT
ncbi:MAG TPA: hypothetical protein VKX46_05160, partial [Ktedonobacteraceae bacterium]|nr:hypothetical protein [Ktedonobacteraceae bacterium]